MLKELIRPEIKVMSIEDPVAYRLNGVTQLAVQAATGVTYAVALRTVLCQDPDVILLG
jgi:general secretion pathway protein E